MRAIVFAFALLATPLAAQETPEAEPAPDAKPDITPEVTPEAEGPMTLMRLAEIVRTVDPEAEILGTQMFFTLADIPVVVVTDPLADRMRAMVPIRSAEGMSAEELLRVMQANFDTALDARYAVARGRLWGVFIHPLSPLERDQVLSALIQTVNVARTYGQTYSSGAVSYGGGDSNELFRELLEEFRKRGEEL